MSINDLVKDAIQDKSVRHNLLYNTDDILKQYGVEICIEKSYIVYEDKSILQGGYRP